MHFDLIKRSINISGRLVAFQWMGEHVVVSLMSKVPGSTRFTVSTGSIFPENNDLLISFLNTNIDKFWELIDLAEIEDSESSEYD